MKKNRTCKIFSVRPMTLMEILTVIMIICILASFLFSNFSHVKQMAKRMNCLNKVKDIAQANLHFAAENDEQACVTPYYHTVSERGSDGNLTAKTYQHNWFARMIIWKAVAVNEGTYNSRRFDTSRLTALSSPIAAQNAVDGTYIVAPDFWSYMCDNVLPPWCDKAMYGHNVYHDPVWLPIREKYPVLSTFAVSMLGNFSASGCTANTVPVIEEDYDIMTRKFTGYIQRQSSILPMSAVKKPSVRAYVTERGERDDENNFMETYFIPFKTQVTGVNGDATGYIAGMGAAGNGKEKMESVGFASDMTNRPNFDAEHRDQNTIPVDRDPNGRTITSDVMEGRHDGYTLHGYFDGHAEAVKAEEVGKHQLSPKGVATDKDNWDLNGMYGHPCSASEDVR